MTRLGPLSIQESIFSQSRGERCRIEECRAACCSNGVWISIPQKNRILKYASHIAPHLPEERQNPSLWFEGEAFDPDFPEGHAVGTAAFPTPEPKDPERTACVFLRPHDYRCALQIASEELALPYPGLKPYDCALYPILLSEGELLLDNQSPEELRGADCQRKTSGPPRPILDVFAPELTLALGEDAYRELCRLAQEREKTSPEP